MLPLQDENEGSVNLWNVDILPQHYTASQARRPWLQLRCRESIISSSHPICRFGLGL